MDRYTSPDLSRQLAEAGLEQYEEDHELTRSWWGRYERENEDLLWSTWGAGRSLALDLTDVLAELTREREGGPLSDAWGLQTYRGHHSMTVWIESRPVVHEHDSPVEAAATVLLALLRERAKP